MVIVRLPNWLGDTVMAVPAIRTLRNGLGDARIAVAGPWAPLLAGQGLADVLVSYPRALGGRLRSADAVRDLGPTVALVLPNSLESALAAWYWGARRRIGFRGGGRTWLLTDPVPVPSPRRHQVDEYLLVIERLGLVPVTREPTLTVPAPDAAERGTVRGLLREAGVDGDRASGRAPRIGVHLGAAFGPSKLWPIERVVDFCRFVAKQGGVPILLGAADARAVGAAIQEAAPALSLVGRDSPTLLPSVLTEMHGIVCGDTGIAHLAAALGTPVVTLFGPTDPGLTAPRGRQVEVLTHATPCAPCFYRTCPIDHPCLRSITAEEVGARLERLLDQWP